MYDEIKQLAEALGFQKCGETKGRLVPCDITLRRFCEKNVCGKYGKSYMCPPAQGPAEALVAKLHNYKDVLVFTKEYPCDDIKNYIPLQIAHEKVCQTLWKAMQEHFGYTKENARVLTTGGCHICKECGIITGEPCRHPNLACHSVSGYCIKVAELCENIGLSMEGENGGVVLFCFVLLK